MSMTEIEELEALREAMKENPPINAKVLQLQRDFSSVSPEILEDILEELADWNCLNDRGKTLRMKFWETFIKE